MNTRPLDPSEVSALRTLIEGFIQLRLEPKLEAIDKKIGKASHKQDRAELEEKRDKLLADYEREPWLEDAARRVGQIQLVTHALKFSHPNARGSSLYLDESVLESASALVGTHTLGSARSDDIVGNAAALDVFKFLTLEHAGESLLRRMLRRDPATATALSDDAELANEWVERFIAITTSDDRPATHNLARQLYFPLGEDGDYHLLAPLFATSLVHEVHGRLRETRFGDAAKAARAARKNGKPHSLGYHEFPHLAIQVYGGSKPQNISQLNSQRYGENWLLPSCPPVWRSPDLRPPFGVRSVFPRRFGARPFVRELTTTLAKFLSATDYRNFPIRQARANLVVQLCDELLLFVAELHRIAPGWSANPECRLDPPEALWLDPGRVETDEPFAEIYEQGAWRDEIAARFGRWLNAQLRKKARLPVGDAEQREWERAFNTEQRQWRRTIADDLEELAHA